MKNNNLEILRFGEWKIVCQSIVLGSLYTGNPGDVCGMHCLAALEIGLLSSQKSDERSRPKIMKFLMGPPFPLLSKVV